MKSRFLTVGNYESLLSSNSYEDFIKILSGTYYGQVITRDSGTTRPSPEDLALILSRDFADVAANLSRSLTGKVREFTNTYLEMFMAESVKSIIRGIHVGLDREEILRFAVPSTPEQASLFESLVDSGSVSKMIDLLPQWDLRVALLTKLPSYEEFNSPAPLEVAIEEWYLKKVLEALEGFSPCETCEGFCQKACPVKAFPQELYRRPNCLKQINADVENRVSDGEIGENGKRNLVIKYCRACELSCPVGAKSIAKSTITCVNCLNGLRAGNNRISWHWIFNKSGIITGI